MTKRPKSSAPGDLVKLGKLPAKKSPSGTKAKKPKPKPKY